MRTLITCFLFSILFVVTSNGQVQYRKTKPTRQRNFENVFYKQINTTVAAKRIDTIQKPNVISRAAIYMVKYNVYPTEDMSYIIYELNKSRNISYQSTQDTLKMPKFTALSSEAIVQLQTEYGIAKKNDPETNNLFKNEADFFNNYFNRYHSVNQAITPFFDSLTMLNARLIPAIKNSVTSISKAKMEYFLKALRNINAMMNLLLSGSNNHSKTKAIYHKLDGSQQVAEKNIQETIEALIADIWSAGVYKAIYFKTKLKASQFNTHVDLFMPLSSLMEKRKSREFYFFDTDNPANAAIYVYVNDNGAQSESPANKRYQVFYGSNGLKYSLSFTTDTLSLFNFRPQNLASTLPIVLGTGRYCFVLRDISTGKLEIRPDVDLTNEAAERDAKGLVIIPFIIFK
jgi:hypothetical protein